MIKKLFLLFIFNFFFLKVFLQTIIVGNSSDNFMRREQISGVKDDRSFLIRPLTNSLGYKTDSLYPFLKENNSSNNHFTFLPLDWIQQYNSNYPYGLNDGAMIPASGYQTMFRAGVYAEWGPLSIQLNPEIVWAQNKSFDGFPKNQSSAIWSSYFANVLNGIDAPERFGNKSYSKLLPGQSSIRLNIKKISFGISSENLWWGPGIRNSILMSNSAPGFPHLTLNTISPIHTGIGSFEAQLIAGNLTASGFLPVDTTGVPNVAGLYVPKNNDSRYLNGLVIVWQPKWIHGLYLGYAASTYEYTANMQSGSGISKYLPIFHGFFRGGDQSLADNSDGLSSVFFRWVFAKAKAEIYFEWARNDGSYNLRDLLLSPEHSRAYIIGAKKLIELNKPQHFIEILAENTHMQLPLDYVTRRADPTFYIHNIVSDGYTNMGQYIGAGIGPGSNSETLDISYINGINKFGLMFEKIDHNMDFFNQTFSTTLNQTRPWSDISVSLHGQWKYNRFLFSSELAWIYSANYEWWKISGINYVNGMQDVSNIHAVLSLSYRLQNK